MRYATRSTLFNPHSILGVRNVPRKWNIKRIATTLVPYLNTEFSVEMFRCKRGMDTKVAYLHLPPECDIKQTLRCIQKVTEGEFTLYGFIPNCQPHEQTRREQYRQTPENVFVVTLRELVIELQYKYPKLYELSARWNHRVLEMVSDVVCDGLMEALDTEGPVTCHDLSERYRRRHPHSEDYALVLGCVRRAEHALGLPPAPHSERQWLRCNPLPPNTERFSFTDLRAKREKYIAAVSNKIREHLDSLKTDLRPDSVHRRAAVKVRRALKNLQPHITNLCNEAIIVEELIPKRELKKFVPVRIYGEPQLPQAEEVSRALFECQATPPVVLERLYNCLKTSVPCSHYGKIMAMNGLTFGNSKLIIRPAITYISDLYVISKKNASLMKRISVRFTQNEHSQRSEMSEYETLDSDKEADLVEDTNMNT